MLSFVSGIILTLASCAMAQSSNKSDSDKGENKPAFAVSKTDKKWKRIFFKNRRKFD